MKALLSVSYATDLTDREWALLEPLLPPAKPGGRPRSVNLRVIRERSVLRAAQWLPVAVAATHLRFLGLPCMPTTARGACRASGNTSMLSCVADCGGTAGVSRPPAPPLWTANPSKPPNGVAHMAMMARRSSRDVNAICWSTHSAWCSECWCTLPTCRTVRLRLRCCATSSPVCRASS